MRHKVRFALALVVFVMAFTSVVMFRAHGNESAVRDENGVNVYDYTLPDEYGRRMEIFTDFDPSSTSFIYNEAGGTSTASGSVIVEGLADVKTVQIAVPTLGSASLTVQIEGRNRKAGTWGLIFSKVYTAAETIDRNVNVLESVDSIRAGLKIATDGTDTVSVFAKFGNKVRGR